MRAVVVLRGVVLPFVPHRWHTTVRVARPFPDERTNKIYIYIYIYIYMYLFISKLIYLFIYLFTYAFIYLFQKKT